MRKFPVRPGFETAVKASFAPENWSGDIWQGEGVPGFEDGGALDIADEMQAQTGGDVFSRRRGFVTLKAGDALVRLTVPASAPMMSTVNCASQDMTIAS